MIRGLQFRIPNGIGSFIFDILEIADIDNSVCSIGYNEIYTQNNKSLLEKDLYLGEDFKRITQDNSYCIIFLELFMFPAESELKEISYYEDFVNSNCELILLIVDSTYVSIYHKDQDILSKLFEHYRIKGFLDIEYVEEDDSRYIMKVY